MPAISTSSSFDPTRSSGAGAWKRPESRWRDEVTADGSSGYPAEAGRYHLYVSLACPWAHRTIIVRRLKGLEQAIGMTIVDPIRDERGWAFTGAPGTDLDPVHGFELLSEVYELSEPGARHHVSVPVLFDRETNRIVNNESSEIIRMLDRAWDAFTDVRLDLYPEPLRAEIDELEGEVYNHVNNGVYACGFAGSQQAYDHSVRALFETLDRLEMRLGGSRYLHGDRITEADWRLFTTLVRFDPVYHTHFKCNLRLLADSPNLLGFARDLYQVPGVAETVDLDQIKRHYYMTHPMLNPRRLVAVSNGPDLAAPHGRG
ncbi:MAG TPA: glutathione S-transferase family protein [Gaiellales bacterium]|jgi:putative glutathione S-transferase